MSATDAPRRAMVLGSGGVLGFAWLLGALSAVETEAHFDVHECEVLIGTSAGSVAAALLGCGLSVDQLRRHHQGEPSADGEPDLSFDYQTGVGEALPPRPGWRPASPALTRDWLRHPRSISPLMALTGLLPPGRGSLAAVRALVDGVAEATGYADRWPQSPTPWIAAADHLTGRRVVFGRDDLGPAADGTERVVRRATLGEAVQASCSIPGWYAPTVIDGVPYVDGGAVSIASVDLLRHTGADEVYILAPMASLEPDHPTSATARFERRIRRVVTRRIVADAEKLRTAGMRVHLLTPGPRDLTVMGANMMNPDRRTAVLDMAREGAAEQLRADLFDRSRWSRAVPDGRQAQDGSA